MSDDLLLWREGFKIHSRKDSEQPFWERNGEIINQTAALRMAKYERAKRFSDAAKGQKHGSMSYMQ